MVHFWASEFTLVHIGVVRFIQVRVGTLGRD